MLRGVRVAVAVVAVVTVATGGVVATETNENQAPMPAAGLDQSVQEGSVVYLDAGGSYDPDGHIEQYRWTITAPNGTTLRPRCESCALTRFVPDRAGTYDVRVTVTDDDGASRSDTLYVTVEAAAPPSVDLDGPTRVTEGQEATFAADVQAGDHGLSELVWSMNGTVLERQSISGEAATRRLTYTFSKTGESTLRVRATDRIDEIGTVRHVVDVTARSSSSSSPAPGPTGGNQNTYTPTIHRPADRSSDNDAYQLLLSDGVVKYGGGEGVVFDKQAVDWLLNQQGVTKTKHGKWVAGENYDSALVVKNQRIKDQLDKEVDLRGFKDKNAKNVNPDINYDQSKWSVTSPGWKGNWKRVDKRKLRTESTYKRTSQQNYELVDTKTVRTGQTYVSKNKRNPTDVRVGTGSTRTTKWYDSRWAAVRGEVIDRRVTSYTWQERHTDTYTKQVRQRVGRRPIYGTRQITKEVMEWQCAQYDSLAGTRLCIEYRKVPTTKTFTESYLKGYEVLYNSYTKTVTETEWRTKSGKYRPNNGPHVRNVRPNYDYKVAMKTEAPKWAVVDTKYEYNVYEYKWKYDA